MSFDYAAIKTTASEIIAEFGQVAYVRSRATTSTDPAAGTVTQAAPVDTAVNCVKTRFNKRNTPPDALIEQGDWLAILDGDIGIENQLLIGSEVWEVIDVFPVEPGATGIIWKAQIRR
jgi:hypothetical protein